MSDEVVYSGLAVERHGRSVSDLESTYKGDASIYISQKTLVIAERQTVFKQFGMQAKHPEGSSQTIQFTRYDRLSLPKAPVSDGVTPGNTPMTISTILAVQDEWISIITITDQAELSVAHGPLAKAIDLMGYQVAETVDRECFEALMGGTRVVYGHNGTSFAGSRSAITSSYVMNKEAVGKSRAALSSRGAHRFDGANGTYMGVADPSVTEDIVNQSTFIDSKRYKDEQLIYNSEVGVWGRIRWIESNHIPTLMRLDASSNIGIDPTTLISIGSTGGSIGTANYDIVIEAYDALTGHLKEVTTTLTNGGSGYSITSGQKLTITTPNDSGYLYNIYVGLHGATLYQQNSSFIAYNTATAYSSLLTSGNAPSSAPASGVVVHFSFVLGQEAYAVPELLPVETFITPKAPTDSDPACQRRKVSWKSFFKPVICNNDYFIRIETGSEFDV